MPQGTDFGTAIFKAVYNGVETQKILSVIKSKQGETGDTGAQGDPTGITVSATEPTSKYTGMLWQNTGTSGGRIKDATYRWTGSTWELFYFTAENIKATTLAAITTNLGTVNAGTINGVDIYASYINGSTIEGATISGNSDINVWSTTSSGGKLWTKIDENGITLREFTANGTLDGQLIATTSNISTLAYTKTLADALYILKNLSKPIQRGQTAAIDVPAGGYKDTNISFGEFSSVPFIFLTFKAGTQNTKYLGLAYLNDTTTGATIRVTNAGTAQYTVFVNWLAIS
jgi:hypothetical protein